MEKTRNITIRVSPETLDALHQAAAFEGRTMSSYLNRLLYFSLAVSYEGNELESVGTPAPQQPVVSTPTFRPDFKPERVKKSK